MVDVIEEKGMNYINPDTEKLKLYKNSKGYTWDIQMCLPKGMTWEEAVKKIGEINTMMLTTYG